MANVTLVTKRPDRGFSLVEMLIVVAIVAILAAVSLPNIAQYVRNYRIKGAAQEVAGVLQTARSRAIMSNTHGGVSLAVVFISRQPIFDRQERVWAYELCSNSDPARLYAQPDHNAALNRTRGSLKVLYEKVAAGIKLLVQYSPGVFPPADLLGLPKESVVLEISGDVPADGELLKWCQDFKEGGRLLALSQVDWPADASHPLL